MKFNKHIIYISLFAILYLIVAFSSFWHAVAFFGLANNSWMSIILAFAFEVGQAAVLFSLLTSKKDRGRVMPWVLMSMFTLVQVIGNVYSSYKYIISNSVANLRYFKEPIFIWTDLPDAQANVIIVYLVGALLPIAALLLTSMITNYLEDIEESKDNSGISNETKEKLRNMLQEALDNTTKEDYDAILDHKDSEHEIDEEVGDIDETDTDENVIDEHGDSVKVLTDTLNNKDKEIEQLKEEHDKLVDEKYEKEQQLQNALEATGEMNKSLVEKNDEIQKLKEKLKVHEENPLINDYSILQMEKQGLEESNKKKDEEIDNLKKQLEKLKETKEIINETEENKETLRDNRSDDSIQQKNEKIEQSGDKESNDVSENIEEYQSDNSSGESETEDSNQSESSKETKHNDETNKENAEVDDENLKMAAALMGGNVPNKNRVNSESHFINNDKK